MKIGEAFVEWQVVGVSAILCKRSVEIELVDTAAARWKLVGLGVVDFGLNEMRLQNVVDRLIVFSDVEMHRSEIESLIFYMLQGSEISDADRESAPMTNRIERIQNGELRLLWIQPIGGAEILMLAQAIDLSPCE